MIRLIAIAFALALASSAQAMPPVPLQQTDEMVITVREACGAGMRRTAGGDDTYGNRASIKRWPDVACWHYSYTGGRTGRVRAGTVQMVGTALARMAAATPIVSACF